MENCVYDESGQLLTGTFMDYAMPRAEDVPSFATAFQETLNPDNPLGAKGVGESGAIGPPPAVVNAVVDALADFGRSPYRHAADAGTGLESHSRRCDFGRWRRRVSAFKRCLEFIAVALTV